jgi:urease beta subunit
MRQSDGLLVGSRARENSSVRTAVDRERRRVWSQQQVVRVTLDELERRQLLSAVTVGDLTLVEGTGGVTTALVPVTLDAASTSPVTVRLQTVNGTAKAGQDFVRAVSSVVFAPGETSKNVPVNVIGDARGEDAEAFSVRATRVQRGTIAKRTGTVTVTDDDTPALRVQRAAVVEGNAGRRPQPIVLTLSGPNTRPVTATYTTVDGSAVAGSDYVARTGTVRFAPGQTRVVIPITLRGDADLEGDETFTLALTNVQGATVAEGADTVTIIDDDGANRALVDDATVREGNSGYSTLRFRVRLLRPSDGTVAVGYETEPGDRALGDYVSVSGTLEFAAGQQELFVEVPVVGDRFFEGNEQVFLNLFPVQGAEVAVARATGTIVDDDAVPTKPPATVVLVGDASAVEGNSGTTPVVFTVQLSAASTDPVLVYYRTASGSAIDGVDFNGGIGAVRFAPGETVKTVTVNALGDDLAESDEQFTLELQGASNASISPTRTSATGTIVNDDNTTPGLQVGNTSVVEGNNGTASMVFTLVLTAPSATQVTVDFATADGTATAGVDYAATSGTLTFAPGETIKQVAVAVAGDGTFEVDETFTLTLSNAVGAPIGQPTGTGTIQNDDVPLDGLAVNNVYAPEFSLNAFGPTYAMFVVTLGGTHATPVTVSYTTQNGTAGAADFTAGSGTVTFAPGETKKTIRVNVADDNLVEGLETFSVVLSNASPGIDIVQATGTATIVDDDTPPSIVVTGISSVQEGDSGTPNSVTFNVALLGPAGSPVTVNYAAASGGATLGVDFVATSGTLSFAASASSFQTQQVTVPIVGDLTPETIESVLLQLSGAVGGTISSPTGTAFIQDDDTVPTAFISGEDKSENEASHAVVFTIDLITPFKTAVTIDYATLNGSATAGTDYTATSGTLTFAPGETTKTVSVTVLNDTVAEADKSFQLVLSNPTNASLAVDRATGNILDDDTIPTVSVTAPVSAVPEGDTGGTEQIPFEITLSHPYNVAVTIPYSTSDGTATAGQDYTAASGSVTFQPGETSQIVLVDLIGDLVDEGNEDFSITINASGYSSGTTTATGTIENDDAPVLVVGNPRIVEGDSGQQSVRFTVQLTRPAPSGRSYDYSTSDGSATAGQDYTATSGTLAFSTGQTFAFVDVPILGDSLVESNETFTLTLNSSTLGGDTGTGTIYDDDDPDQMDLDVSGLSILPPLGPLPDRNEPVPAPVPAPVGATTLPIEFTVFQNGPRSNKPITARFYVVPVGQSGVRYEVLATDSETGQPVVVPPLLPSDSRQFQVTLQVVMPDNVTLPPVGWYFVQVELQQPDEDSGNNVATTTSHDSFPFEADVPRGAGWPTV